MFDNESLIPNRTFTQAWISGMHRKYISISAHPDSEMFVIQFKGMGAYPFLHFPVEKLNEKVIPAEEIFGEEIVLLREELLMADEVTGKFALAEQWLMSRFDEEKVPPKELLNVVDQIQSESAKSCQEITINYPKTQKHLIDLFKKYIGLTPKYYHRILRFS